MGFETRWNNLLGGLAVKLDGRSKRPDELTSSIVPRGTSFHPPGGVSWTASRKRECLSAARPSGRSPLLTARREARPEQLAELVSADLVACQKKPRQSGANTHDDKQGG